MSGLKGVPERFLRRIFCIFVSRIHTRAAWELSRSMCCTSLC